MNPKKVQQCRDVLNRAFNDPHRRFIVFAGPTGCGKSTMVRVLSSVLELDFDILEWINPINENQLSVDLGGLFRCSC